MDATSLALLPIPEAAQVELLDSRRLDEARAALTASPYLTPAVARTLLADRLPSNVWRAIRVIDDVEMLTYLITSASPSRAAAAARNPNTPADALSIAVRRDHIDTALAALVNPSTPCSDRAEIATPERLTELTSVGSSLGFRVIRCAEVVRNNPFLAATPQRFDGPMQRAFASMPTTSMDSLRWLRTNTRFGGKFLRTHPLLNGELDSFDACTPEQLAAFEHPATDLLAISHPDCTLDVAQRMLTRVEDPVEPHVLAAALQRFSLQAMLAVSSNRFAGTRTGAATWTAPAARYIEHWSTAVADEVRDGLEAIEILGDRQDRWRCAFDLLPSWSLSLRQLAETAIRLNS